MRRVLTVLAVLTLVVPASGAFAQTGRERSVTAMRTAERRVVREQRGGDRETQTERITRTVNIGADGEIDLSNIAGDITVTRGGGTTAAIEIVKTARAETADEARAILALVTVDVAERGPRVEIRTRYPGREEMRGRGRRNFNVDVAFNIAAPQNTRVIARSISGNINVRDISGALTLDSVSGAVKLANAGRMANAKSISGNVEMVDSRVDGALSAGTISGTIKLQKVTAHQLSLSSVSGAVWLQDVVCERIEGQAISGDIQFSGDFEPNGRYEFTSHSGSVRLAVGGKTGFQIEATSFSGEIKTDVPVTLEGGQTSRRTKALRGKYGDGSAFLDLTSFSGSILITKR
jgi:hypothetical protein